jgi:hypothetical protein
MPTWLRRFTYNKLKEWFDAQSKENEKYLVNEESKTPKAIIPQEVKNLMESPSYNVKTSKKK